jgi:hypothetical protein
MIDPIGDYFDRLLAPKAIDPRQVALIMQPYFPERSLRELEIMVNAMAVRDGYRCVCQDPPDCRLK